MPSNILQLIWSVIFILRGLYLNAELDFRFPVGAPLHGINAFLSTNQLKVTCLCPLRTLIFQFMLYLILRSKVAFEI